jgi:uncharacterized membrane protein
MDVAQDKEKVYIEALGVTKDHLLVFADAIFSIAVTLLVLEIRFPEIPPGSPDMDFVIGFLSASPAIMAYAITFFVVASYWLSYHRIFHYLERIDRRVTALSALFLFFIAFMPFPTMVVGLHIGQLPVVVFYAVTVGLSSGILWLIWRHSARSGLIDTKIDDHFREYLAVRLLLPAVVFFTSVPVAWLIHPVAGMAWWGLVAVSGRAVERAYHVKRG